ncbi:hypothetical protein [Paenibacillus andongensis]|uniref:hypothetical protein n=1 Tax=Paenibacillus andongensis TaxID=2975482 RepID=UPI0021BAE8A5|nr:hypothetical protein [Paenibacillus andongensis]
MNLTLQLEHLGWININFTSDDKQFYIPGSFLTDFVYEFTDRISTLAEGANEVIVRVQTELGEYRIFVKQETNICLFNVFEFDDNFSTYDLDEGVCVYEDKVELKSLMNIIFREITKLKNLGNEEYFRLWGNHFPELPYKRLIRARDTIKHRTNNFE